MSRILGYGRNRSAADLEQLGADVVFSDHHNDAARNDLMCEIRPGDVVRVLYLTDLSGCGVHNARWRDGIEAMGATVEELRPVGMPAMMGRPSKLTTDAATESKLRAIWLDPARSLADRLDAAEAILGDRVSRQALYRRFGKPGAPMTAAADEPKSKGQPK